MAKWTKQELDALHPEGSVSVQVDDTVTPMTSEEWREWIDGQVGTPKPSDDPMAGA